ncbi:hypothetical protein [Methylobacterium oxalidis]|uniref:Uncharacterized protein n=1 Tax=Methylobacterium oxalidis TaxID=944322 RepID=A0A512IX85_9HYPH|nr:hypothetical protein [Methylobacterium oxalidis]GEP02286.1 hypothetical protein MOX02_03240 [Methylobacterium oxalidis]GJE32276.1 hypothetical protein LDDCCGHA_2462 [Methylobacterium oxalidis]GLS62231.1 hypothetical protein GCM10007888_06120 [Methylobacterium oxalidis]
MSTALTITLDENDFLALDAIAYAESLDPASYVRLLVMADLAARLSAQANDLGDLYAFESRADHDLADLPFGGL